MYKIVDISFLEKFTKGNTAKMKRYISMYLDTAPESFERMQQNIKDESWQELAINAHSLKPQAEFMGIETLKELLMKIENKVRSGQVEGIENLLTKAKSVHIESLVFLQGFTNDI